MGATKIPVTVEDPLGRPIDTTFGYHQPTRTAILDSATSVGLARLSAQERNPMHTSTFGLGEMIREAATLNPNKIIIGLGGSATCDGGMGMAHALGWAFLDQSGNKLPHTGQHLQDIHTIQPPDHNPLPDYSTYINRKT